MECLFFMPQNNVTHLSSGLYEKNRKDFLCESILAIALPGLRPLSVVDFLLSGVW